jgi:hypothetical protein
MIWPWIAMFVFVFIFVGCSTLAREEVARAFQERDRAMNILLDNVIVFENRVKDSCLKPKPTPVATPTLK